jgi:rSAM/selenodomain-associated transferase 1
VNLIVLAKAPAPGRSKTRLCPPCTPEQAAGLAEAALSDTLAAVAATPAARRVLVLDGEPGDWLPAGFEVVAQRGGGLDERLANAFDDVGGPALLIGMDTPQVTPGLLDSAARRLAAADAVLGPALDGGFWALGLNRPDAALLVGVPMSVEGTGRLQHARLVAAALSVDVLDPLQDVDRIEDARAVAASAPQGRFAARLRSVDGAGRGAAA